MKPLKPFQSVAHIRKGLLSGDFSAVELAGFFLQRIQHLDPELNSFITVTHDTALKQAEQADRQLRSGSAELLTGIPLAHKDIFLTEGIKTSCGSRMLNNFIAPYQSTVAARTAEAGCVMLGKTNMDEFAMGSSNENSYFGAVKNPWKPDCVPGGSSGGSAAAVAAGLTPLATGTDTGGSIRQPAAFCGLTGLKPTYGRVSRYGMVAFASSLDQGGAIGHSVEDISLLLAAMAGFDPADSTSSQKSCESLQAFARGEYPALEDGLKIGLPREYFNALTDTGMDELFQQARRTLEQTGVEFVDISLPSTSAAVAVYYVIASAEASTNLSRYDGVRYGHRCDSPVDLEDLYRRSRGEGFGSEVKRRILTGTYTLSVGYYDAYYVKAQKVRRLIRDEFNQVFQEVDAILAPTTPSVAFPIGQLSDDPIQMYQQDAFTTPASLAGLPALSVPCGFLHQLPVGLQLIGPHFSEPLVMEVARRYQTHTDWHLQHPASIAGVTGIGEA